MASDSHTAQGHPTRGYMQNFPFSYEKVTKSFPSPDTSVAFFTRHLLPKAPRVSSWHSLCRSPCTQVWIGGGGQRLRVWSVRMRIIHSLWHPRHRRDTHWYTTISPPLLVKNLACRQNFLSCTAERIGIMKSGNFTTGLAISLQKCYELESRRLVSWHLYCVCEVIEQLLKKGRIERKFWVSRSESWVLNDVNMRQKFVCGFRVSLCMTLSTPRHVNPQSLAVVSGIRFVPRVIYVWCLNCQKKTKFTSRQTPAASVVKMRADK